MSESSIPAQLPPASFIPVAPLDPAAVGAWFTGAVRPARLSPLYRAGLVATAFAMVLLPALYLGIIAAAAAGVWWWMQHVSFLLNQGMFGLLAYGAPVFAGGTVVFFLCKPLLTRAPKPTPPVVLDLAHEPVLAAFLARLCAAVGAPRPAVVHVDCQVNASASFRRGWRSVPRRELALTIGLPLVAGLDARRFAGVLAHEFGHFAQGAGMSATFVIRSVNTWFARVVFERDEWDAKLEALSKQGDLRLMLVVWVARGAVWLARKILHGLMLAGHAISCFQLRQMEFDADHYEIQLAGTASHVATSAELRRLNLAFGQALSDLRTLWSDGRLADDLPEFVRIRRSRLEPAALAETDRQAAAQPTRWHDTHPSDRARIAAAEAAVSPGVFALDAPAAALFGDFATTARRATLAWYQTQIGPEVKPEALVPTGVLLADADRERAARRAFDELVGPALSLERPLTVGPETLSPSDKDTATLVAQRDRAAAELRRQREALQQRQPDWDQTELDSFNAWAAGRLLAHQIKVTPKTFGLSESSTAAATRRAQECAERTGRLAAEYQPAAAAFVAWLGATIGLARECPPSDATAAELIRLAETFVALTPAAAQFPQLGREVRLFSVLVSNARALSGNSAFGMIVSTTRKRLGEEVDALLAATAAIPYPFSSSGEPPVTVAEHLRRAAAKGPTEIEARAYATMQEFAPLYHRVAGRLVWLARQLPPAEPSVSSP